MSDDIVIRELKSMDEIMATVELQRAVWAMHDVEIASPHTLRAIAYTGGCVIAALEGDRQIGFCSGMAAWRWGELWLWSHMTGVRPAYQGQGIGLRLKLAQRDWALARGYRKMAWTFDPMQSGNANFNFNRLGVKARSYSVNHYGDMQDGINAGLASDRLEAQWQLDAPTPDSHDAAGGGGIMKLVYVDADGRLCLDQPATADAPGYAIEIPLDIAGLKRRDIKRAQQWQLYARQAMTGLLAAGYIVSGFQRQASKAWYSLSRPA